jgi:hypothetical protein
MGLHLPLRMPESNAACDALQVELRRQSEQIEWAERFLEYERVKKTPLGFLRSWKCHTKLRSQFCQQVG